MTKKALIEALAHVPDDAILECAIHTEDQDVSWYGIVGVESGDGCSDGEHYLIGLTSQPVME